MDTFHILLVIIITVLLGERVWDRYLDRRQQDDMNRALIARTVPEYQYTEKGEINRVKLENELAQHADSIADKQQLDKTGPHHPVM